MIVRNNLQITHQIFLLLIILIINLNTRFQNPSRTLRDIIADSSSNYVIDRANCLTCDETVTTQQKLLVRKKDRPTPFRVPYNHYRKVSSCNTSDCLPNVKINKDISCNEIQNLANLLIMLFIDKLINLVLEI